MATHFTDEDENGTSTPEAITALAPVTAYVSGTFEGTGVVVMLGDDTDTLQPVKRLTAPEVLNVVATGYVAFKIEDANSSTSITVITES